MDPFCFLGGSSCEEPIFLFLFILKHLLFILWQFHSYIQCTLIISTSNSPSHPPRHPQHIPLLPSCLLFLWKCSYFCNSLIPINIVCWHSTWSFWLDLVQVMSKPCHIQKEAFIAFFPSTGSYILPATLPWYYRNHGGVGVGASAVWILSSHSFSWPVMSLCTNCFPVQKRASLISRLQAEQIERC